MPCRGGLCSIRSVRYLVSLLYGSLHIENMMNINIIIQSEWRPRGLCMEMILISRIGVLFLSLSLILSPPSVSFSYPLSPCVSISFSCSPSVVFLLSNTYTSICVFLLSLSPCVSIYYPWSPSGTLSLVLHLHLYLSLILYLLVSLSLILDLHLYFFFCPTSPSVSVACSLSTSFSFSCYLPTSVSFPICFFSCPLSPSVSFSYPLSPTCVSPIFIIMPNSAKE
jgi:hypothetical protein